MTNYKKIILTTVLWTITSLVILTALIVFIMVFAFPKNLGNFFHSLGCENLASSMYMRVYEKDDDISYCYKALNIEISCEHNAKIIKLYETFTSDENYKDFISQLKEHNEKLNVNKLEKSSLLNEENYLTNKYIKALINSNETRKAYNLAIENFKAYKNFSLKNQGVYSLNHFINLDGYNNFNANVGGFDSSLIDAMKDYFNRSISIFEEGKSLKSDLDYAYMISLGNRIIQVGQNINSIIDSNEEKEQNNLKMESVNNYIKEIV